MRKILATLIALAFGTAAAAVAQTAPIGVCLPNSSGGAQTISGGVLAPLPYASITLCSQGSTATNCAANAVTIYTSTALSTTTPNPFTADAGGNFFFCASVGHYAMLVSASVGSYFVPDITLADNWAAGGKVSGIWNATNLVGEYINGIPQADQFPGADFCVKLQNAMIAALSATPKISLIDATHFSGTQQCSVNPFSYQALGLAQYSTTQLTVDLPAATIDVSAASAQWAIQNSGINLIGKGPGQTWIIYTGTGSLTTGVISSVGSGTSFISHNQIVNLSVLGNANVTDAIYLNGAQRWKLENVDTWAVTGCGIHTLYSVTTTFIRPRTSFQDASTYGWPTTTVPTSGLCFDANANGQTTDGTVIDAAAENLTGVGWNLISANSMTFTSGTSEDNSGGGIEIQNASGYDTFISTDLEGNGSFDVLDNGPSNTFIGVIAASSVSASIQGACPYATIIEGDIVEGEACTGTFYAHNSGVNPIPFTMRALSGWSQLATIPYSAASTTAAGMSLNFSGNGELDFWDAYEQSAYPFVFYLNTGSGYSAIAKISSSGEYLGNAETASALATAPTACSLGSYVTGVAANGTLTCSLIPSGSSYLSGGSTCTTSSAAGSTCTATVPFSVTMPDLNYYISCSGVQPTGFPSIMGVTKGLSSATVTIQNGYASQGVASGYGDVECILAGS